MKLSRRSVVLRLVAALVLVLLLVVILTRPAARDAIKTPAEFVGWVLDVNAGSRQIVVESQAQKIVSRVTVTVTDDTLLFRREAGVLHRIGFSAIRKQDQAELWLNGPVPENFPAQVTARQVIVEKTP